MKTLLRSKDLGGGNDGEYRYGDTGKHGPKTGDEGEKSSGVTG